LIDDCPICKQEVWRGRYYLRNPAILSVRPRRRPAALARNGATALPGQKVADLCKQAFENFLARPDGPRGAMLRGRSASRRSVDEASGAFARRG
jgi:hypothetical protein